MAVDVKSQSKQYHVVADSVYNDSWIRIVLGYGN